MRLISDGSPYDLRTRDRGYLPHWDHIYGVYFVTFRLYDSLPQRLRQASQDSRVMLRLLDRGYGGSLFKQPHLAKIVVDALAHGHGSRYFLRAWCVMPNHVHALLKLAEGVRLPDIVHHWKSYSAHAINKKLGRNGAVWQREYFDRMVRAKDFDRTVSYILNNPERAGLKDWTWWGENAV